MYNIMANLQCKNVTYARSADQDKHRSRPLITIRTQQRIFGKTPRMLSQSLGDLSRAWDSPNFDEPARPCRALILTALLPIICLRIRNICRCRDAARIGGGSPSDLFG